MTDQVKLRRDKSVGTIVLDHPARLNALTPGMIGSIAQGLDDFQGEGRVRTVILTGTGSSFCSGTDLNTLSGKIPEDFIPEDDQDDVVDFQALLESMLRYPKPLIAAVTGWTVGTGLALMLACDMTIAAENSRFWVAEPHRGLSPGLTAPLLIWRIGAARSAAMLYGTEPIDAARAFTFGLINEVQPEQQVWARASEIAAQISEGAAESHQLTRKMMYETVAENVFTQLSIGAAHTATARTTQTAHERIQKFLSRHADRQDDAAG